MLVNLVPEFLAARAARDPLEAYRRYLDDHYPILRAYWHNYVIDLDSPHAEAVVSRTMCADRRDLLHLMERTAVVETARAAVATCEDAFEVDRPIDVYLMVGVGAANAGELVVAGRGIAFICLEHFTGKANAETLGLGLAPTLIPLWIGHEMAHAVRYTSPASRSEMAGIVAAAGGTYDFWESSRQASLRELLANEGLAVAAAEAVAPGFQPWDYHGYTRRQYRRLRELEAFLRRSVTAELDQTGLGLRLRYLSGGMSPAQRLVAGKVIPERAGYYLGRRLVDAAVSENGIAAALRQDAREIERTDARAPGAQTA